MTLENLIALKNGDHKVFGEIFDAWHRRVYRYFLKKTSDEFAAKDLTQQVFIKLWHYRSQVTTELSIDEQLFKKARLIYIDWLRKEATYRKHFSNEEIQELPQYAVTEERLELQQALSYLPAKRKTVFELKHIHGLSYKEIAAQLGISIKTVDNHLLKATAQLRKVFNIYSHLGIFLLTTF